MAKRTRNPNRSFEIIVSAPLEICLETLRGLKAGDTFTRESVTVKAFPIKRQQNMVRYEVKLRISHGRSLRIVPLFGTMQYDENFHTTTVIGEVLRRSDKLYGATFAFLMGVALLLLPFVLSDTQGSLVLVLLFIGIAQPLGLLLGYKIHQRHAMRLLKIVEQAFIEISRSKKKKGK